MSIVQLVREGPCVQRSRVPIEQPQATNGVLHLAYQCILHSTRLHLLGVCGRKADVCRRGKYAVAKSVVCANLKCTLVGL